MPLSRTSALIQSICFYQALHQGFVSDRVSDLHRSIYFYKLMIDYSLFFVSTPKHFCVKRLLPNKNLTPPMFCGLVNYKINIMVCCICSIDITFLIFSANYTMNSIFYLHYWLLFIQDTVLAPSKENGVYKEGYLTKSPFHSDGNPIYGSKVHYLGLALSVIYRFILSINEQPFLGLTRPSQEWRAPTHAINLIRAHRSSCAMV